MTPELGEADAAYYHTLVGVLQWIVELGFVDIDVKVSMMSSHLALPREGHIKELYHIFAYLKARSNAEMVFDPTPIEHARLSLNKKTGRTLRMAMNPSRKSCPVSCQYNMVNQ